MNEYLRCGIALPVGSGLDIVSILSHAHENDLKTELWAFILYIMLLGFALCFLVYGYKVGVRIY